MADWNATISARTTNTFVDDLKHFWRAQGAAPTVDLDTLADVINKELLAAGTIADKQRVFWSLLFPTPPGLTLADYQQLAATI